jgi:hypothetical protein
MIDELLEELGRLKKAQAILEQVHLEYGPYGNGQISWKTIQLMNDYFHFDDSE